MPLQVKIFTFNPIQENTYIISDENKNAVIIDPGCYSREEKTELTDFISDNKLKVLALLNTHCHIDHILGNSFVKKTFDVPFYMHELDLPTLRAVPSYAHVYGFEAYEESPEPDFFVQDNELLNFGNISFKVIFGPGHAPGHVAFYNEENKTLIGGDILFKGSFGRVDLPGGSIEVLKKTMFERIFTLPDDTRVYSGHGSSTTIGVEKQTNYILNF
ncbi:MAG: MBL fold metallo-hydrolase [Bacteroidota bacterium]